MIHMNIDKRQIKAQQIAQQGRIIKTSKGWVVPSQSGNGAYIVAQKYLLAPLECECPDYQLHKHPCKHIYAVEITLKREVDAEGNVTITHTKRVTYPQNWKAYNTAQTSEIKQFDILLRDLTANISEPEQHMGRPRLSLKDSVFCSIQKVYSQLSQRRAFTLYKNSEEREQIGHTPHFNAIGKMLNRSDITDTLQNLLVMSALPLKSIETTFAPDSSGFRVTGFNEYCKEKHGTNKKHKWVKAHVLVGTKTNIVATARITEGEDNDCPHFVPMVTEAHNNGFDIKEIPADMGYSSRENYEMAQSIGATAYIPFKCNATDKARGSLIWKKAYHYFQLNRDDFMAHYHQRSNVESVFNMIKMKFGDRLKSKKLKAQENELLCKLIAHNIVVLIHEMHELGINPSFTAEKFNISA